MKYKYRSLKFRISIYRPRHVVGLHSSIFVELGIPNQCLELRDQIPPVYPIALSSVFGSI